MKTDLAPETCNVVPYVDLVGGVVHDELANDFGEVHVLLVDPPHFAAVGWGLAPVTAPVLVPVIGKTNQEVGGRGTKLLLAFCFLYFIALLTLGGPFYFGIPFLGTLACDHGNWPSQVLD